MLGKIAKCRRVRTARRGIRYSDNTNRNPPRPRGLAPAEFSPRGGLENPSLGSEAEKRTIESFARRLSRLRNMTLLRAAARRKFDLIAATITVQIGLWLNASDCAIRTGRRYPGSDAPGSGSVAHQISLASSPRSRKKDAHCRTASAGSSSTFSLA